MTFAVMWWQIWKKTLKTAEIRKKFLDFFAKRNHEIVKSDSLVPKGDPSLLFTGAGMNQFKEYFLGVKKDLKRATSSQKCLRTGDLDNVGKTPYHHSFFEMLGNFSFGDYFKEDAIKWAWEFLTDELKISSEKLRVSVHASDEEAYQIWRDKIKVKEDWIAKLGDASNFWPANAPKDGPNGPCGPCSEIFYDQGPDYPGSDTKASWYEDESGRFAEIWNLVFTQFDRQDGGALKPLASKNIDTGMGLERLACVMQGKKTNFEIDLFEPMIRAIQEKIIVPAGQKNILYAIADHGRAVTFAILDGAYPSNDGRGYVIRKLIRRSVWRAKTLGAEEPFLYHIVPAVVKAMGDTYPELAQSEKNVKETIRQEEERFFITLDKGLELLSKLIQKAKDEKHNILSGEDVFLLYDTYGFPDELTRMIAAKEGVSAIDQKGFDVRMEEQRKRAKENTKISSNIFSVDEAKKEISHLPKTEFLGYETLEAEGKVLWLKRTGNEVVLILDRSPFYPEGGGQVGDQGAIQGSGFECWVSDTQKSDKITLHIAKVLKGEPKVGDKVKTVVDAEKRNATKRNHTATHLLQAALRNVLGAHVRQVGSLVNSEKLRFDFTHGKALTHEEITKVEARVNQVVLENHAVQIRIENYQDATKKGAIAFFGDKYEDTVRVIDVPNFSTELCGGTHCSRTGDIGTFVITSEGAIASGTRRVEAMTGLGALAYLQSLRSQVKEVAALLKTSPSEISERILKLNQNLKDLEKGGKKQTSLQINVENLINKSKQCGNYKLIGEIFDGADIEELRFAGDQLKRQVKNTVIALFSKSEGKVSLIVMLSEDLKDSKLNAGEIAKELSLILEGSGGGRKDSAQGGGKNPQAIEQAIAKAATRLKATLLVKGIN